MLFQVLVEGFSKRSNTQLSGRTDTMKRVVFDDIPVPPAYTAQNNEALVHLKPGDYAAVKVNACSTGTLFAKPLGRTTLQTFAAHQSTGATGAQAHAQGPVEQKQVAAVAC